jgi:predicted TIM-barrel fold metal-dependent hydrolase
MIVDAHAHIFDRLCGRLGGGAVRGLSYGRARIGNGKPFLALPPFERLVRSVPETLLEMMDWAGVDKAVLLQNNFYGEHNAYVARAARRWPNRFVPAMYLDPWAPRAREMFSRCADHPHGMKIVKLATDARFGLFSLHEGASLSDECCQWLWPEMLRRGMTLTLDLGPIGSPSYENDVVDDIARRYPRLRIVICHLAQPTAIDQEDPTKMRLWREQLLLARRPNIWFDISALPHKAGNEQFPWPTSGRWIRRAIELIGANKLIWGTDLPGVLTVSTYPQLLSQMDVHLAKLSNHERDGVLGLNALRAYPF